MLEWVFGENREEHEQKEEVSKKVDLGAVPAEYDSESNGVAIDDNDSLLFDMPDDPVQENGDEYATESLDSPERHAQQGLFKKIRKDVDDFDYHITQNEIHLKHAREQLIGFRSFLQQTDVEMEQNHRLLRQNNELVTRLDSETQRSRELRSLLDTEMAGHSATRNRSIEFKDLLSSARGENVTLTARTGKLREQLEQYSTSSGKREASLLEASRRSEQLLAENKVLEENYQRANIDMNKFCKEATVLQKTLDEINENGRQGTAEADRLSADVASATEALDKFQAENVELRSRLDNMVAENSASDKRNNSKIRIRDEELFSLRSQVEGLQSELRVRNQMLIQASEEGKKARDDLNIAASTAQSVGEQLTRAVNQNEEQRKHMIEANAKIAEVNTRYKDRLSELEQSRQENLRLKRLLKTELQMFEQTISALPVGKNGTKKRRAQVAIPDPESTKLN